MAGNLTTPTSSRWSSRAIRGRAEDKLTRVRVVTDSTADMEEDEARQLGVRMVPLNVHWNGETYQDKVEITLDEFYRRLREEKGTPRTSQPPMGQFERIYRELLEEADSVVSIHITSKASGTCNAARLAADSVSPERIVVLDSKILSYPLGALVLRVARLAHQGASLRECVALAESLIPRLRLFAAMDTLEFLRRGGRVSRFQAFAGNILSIKPIVHLVDGEILPADRVRTRAASVRRIAELMLALGPVEDAAVLYGDDPAPAEQLLDILKDALPGVTIHWGRTGSVIGAHTGPGVFGAYGLVKA